MGWSRPFKADAGDCNQKKKENRSVVGAASDSDSDSDSVAVGLRILIHLSKGDSDCILVKSKLKLNKPNFFHRNRIHPSPSPSSLSSFPPEYSCFLKSCFLCNRTLAHDTDVFMYRGDQGFCSEECRNRQIYMDEMKELEISTKQMIASYRKSLHGGGGGGRRCETNILREEFRHSHNHNHNHKPLPRKHRAIFL